VLLLLVQLIRRKI